MKKCFQHWLAYTAIFIALCCSAIPGRAQDFIDEDFLDNIEANAKFIWAEPAAAFAVTESPAKWNEESAVVMGYKRSILFDKKSSAVFFHPGKKMFFSLKR